MVLMSGHLNNLCFVVQRLVYIMVLVSDHLNDLCFVVLWLLYIMVFSEWSSKQSVLCCSMVIVYHGFSE